MLVDEVGHLVDVGGPLEVDVHLLVAREDVVRGVGRFEIHAQDGELASALAPLRVLDGHRDLGAAVLPLIVGHPVGLGDDLVDRGRGVLGGRECGGEAEKGEEGGFHGDSFHAWESDVSDPSDLSDSSDG